MEAFAENVKIVHYQASREADNSPQLDPLLQIVDGHYFESVQLFTLPTGIQLAPDSIMRLIWCGCRSYTPCSSRDCGYKRNGFGFRVWIYSSLRMFWFLCKLKRSICPVIIFWLESTIDGEILHLKSSHSEFTRFPVKMYVYGSKIITLDG
jgi:hypothetical protein